MDRIRVECTGSYGAGLLHYLQQAGLDVLEVTTPDRTDRRKSGKCKTFVDGNAACAVFASHRTATPRRCAGLIESLRVLKTGRKNRNRGALHSK